jgi:hypothetical protein
MTTIVSAFISNINDRYSDSLTQYYNHGKFILEANIPKIIFVDEPMFELISDNYNKLNTLIIKINKTDLYLYDLKKHLTKFHLNSTNSSKDTLDYIFTMCNKTEWIRQSIELNYFKTYNFIWIDFGIKHIFKEIPDEDFVNKINNLKNVKYNSVRIGKIWDLNCSTNIDIYKDIVWYFAGGIFGGKASYLITFADLMKLKCTEIITTKNTIMWEVNIWYLIYKENSYLFDSYYCNHDTSLIDNY